MPLQIGTILIIGNIKDISAFLKSRFSRQNTGEVLWFFGGQVLVFVASILVVKLLTGMGKSAYGEYSLVLTNIAFWSLFIYNPVNQGFNRFYFEYNDKSTIPLYLNLIQKFLLQISIALVLLSVTAGIITGLVLGIRIGILVFLAGILTVFFKISEFSTSLLNIIRVRKFNAVIGSVERYSFILTILGLIYFNLLSLENVLICYIGVSAVFGFVKVSKFYKSHEPLPPVDYALKPEIIKRIKIYIFPFVAWGISGWLQLNGEKWVIANYLSAAELGVYAVMLNIINAMISFPTYFITDFFTPHIFNNFSSGASADNIKAGYSYIRINLLVVGGLILFAVIINYFLGSTFVKLISSESFVNEINLLPLLTIGTGFFYIGHVLTNVGLALGKTREYIIPKVGAGILSLVLNILFIIYFGLTGIAIAINITGLCYVIYLVVVNKKLVAEFEK